MNLHQKISSHSTAQYNQLTQHMTWKMICKRGVGEWVKHTKAIILLKENPITKTSLLGTYFDVVVCIRKDLEVLELLEIILIWNEFHLLCREGLVKVPYFREIFMNLERKGTKRWIAKYHVAYDFFWFILQRFTIPWVVLFLSNFCTSVLQNYIYRYIPIL